MIRMCVSYEPEIEAALRKAGYIEILGAKKGEERFISIEFYRREFFYTQEQFNSFINLVNLGIEPKVAFRLIGETK